MSSKITKDFACEDCGVEYMVTFDYDNVVDQPMYCPFCSSRTHDYDDMDVDGFEFEDDDD